MPRPDGPSDGGRHASTARQRAASLYGWDAIADTYEAWLMAVAAGAATGARPPPPVDSHLYSADDETALITGITGQDGSYLAEFLLDRGTGSSA